jgi:hypothetical protein
MTDTDEEIIIIEVPCIDLTGWYNSNFGMPNPQYDLPPIDAIPMYWGNLIEYENDYEITNCATLFNYINTISTDSTGYYGFTQQALCNPDPRWHLIESGGPAGYYPPLTSQLMAYLCPEECNTCTDEVVVEEDDEGGGMPTPPEISRCDCWENGNDYMSFLWDPSPGCCYGCMDENDWFYDDWATCHVQHACKDDANGALWPWMVWNSGANPAGDIIGCEPADRRIPGSHFEDRSQGRKNGPKLDANGKPITK